jgi:hypothetical protein
MRTYGIFGGHTTEGCPLFNRENRRLLLSMVENFENKAHRYMLISKNNTILVYIILVPFQQMVLFSSGLWSHDLHVCQMIPSESGSPYCPKIL